MYRYELAYSYHVGVADAITKINASEGVTSAERIKKTMRALMVDLDELRDCHLVQDYIKCYSKRTDVPKRDHDLVINRRAKVVTIIIIINCIT